MKSSTAQGKPRQHRVNRVEARHPAVLTVGAGGVWAWTRSGVIGSPGQVVKL